MDSKRYTNRKVYIYLLLFFTLLISASVSVSFNELSWIRLSLWGFILFFLPGLFLLRILDINFNSVLHVILLAIGLSIAFVMLYGWVYNELAISLGFGLPLLAKPLSAAFLIPIMILGILSLRKWHNLSLYFVPFNSNEKKIVIISATIPIVAVTGVFLINRTGNNIGIVLALIEVLAFFLIIASLEKRLELKDNVYGVVIISLSIGLVLIWALRSNHIIGVDAHLEYYLFQLTEKSHKWAMFSSSDVNTCLSVTLLPDIFCSLAGITNFELFFRVFYPLLFSISPLLIYVISRKYLEPHPAFISSFFYMSFINFQMTTAQARTNIAVLFVCFLVYVLYISNISLINKRILFIIFSLALIGSHYSTTYATFFVLTLSSILYYILKWYDSRISMHSKGVSDSVLTSNSLIMFFVFIYMWYGFITYYPFYSGVGFISNSFMRLKYMFVLGLRAEAVNGAVGIGLSGENWAYRIDFIFYWLCMLLIIIGLLWAFRNLYNERIIIDKDFWLLSLGCFVVLIITIVVPYISIGYDVTRVFLLAMIAMALYLPIGGALIFEKRLNEYTPIIISFIVAVYFAGQTGLIYQAFGYPLSMILNDKGTQYNKYFINSTDVASAKWLGSQAGNQIVYTDANGNMLLSQAMIPEGQIDEYTLFTGRKMNGLLFLRRYSISNNIIFNKEGKFINISGYEEKFISMHLVYSNGYSKILKAGI